MMDGLQIRACIATSIVHRNCLTQLELKISSMAVHVLVFLGHRFPLRGKLHSFSEGLRVLHTSLIISWVGLLQCKAAP